MITLDVADLTVIAGQVLGIAPGTVLDRLDLAAAQAALAEAGLAGAEPAGAEPTGPRPTAAEPTAAEPTATAFGATVLIRALLRHRPFPVGQNQQVAVAAGLQFLA